MVFAKKDGMFSKSRNVINFSPGPAKIPEAVLDRIQLELHEHGKTGISILELSHRSKEFEDLLNKTRQNLRELAQIPSHYQVLFLQGGGTGQFSGIPLNLKHMNGNAQDQPLANYLVTGSWSAKAAKEAAKYLDVNMVISPPPKKYITIPDQSTWNMSPNAAYFYYCSNETIEGVEFKSPPDVDSKTHLVADISSNAFSQPIDVSKHGLLFAGAQKNLGTSGLTIVIVRDDLIGHADRNCPSILDYKVMHQSNSNYNTPPVFCIYVTNMVLNWIRDLGGLDELKRINERKAELIYDVINKYDDFYCCPVDKHCRSRMNIPFRIGSLEGNTTMEKLFLEGAESKNMVSLKGYRTVGGVRASLYNAITVQETKYLADFMEEFYDKHATQK